MKQELLVNWAQAQGLTVSGKQLAMLTQYQTLVLDTNRKMNLTAITNDEAFTINHFIDSMTVLPWIPQGAKLCDIGTGAGFPGVVLKIMRPDIQLTLLDSLSKRVQFLRGAVAQLGISGVQFTHANVKQLLRERKSTSSHHEAYDVCTARAVAKLDVLAEYALPMLAPGGRFLAMKGPDVTEELAMAQSAIVRHGGVVLDTARVEIAPALWRTIVVIELAT